MAYTQDASCSSWLFKIVCRLNKYIASDAIHNIHLNDVVAVNLVATAIKVHTIFSACVPDSFPLDINYFHYQYSSVLSWNVNLY